MSGDDQEITARVPEDDLEELYEHAPCGYISTTPAGNIVRVNETFLRQVSRDRGSLLAGVKFQELMSMAGRVFWDTHFALAHPGLCKRDRLRPREAR